MGKALAILALGPACAAVAPPPCWSRQLATSSEMFTALGSHGELTIATTFADPIDVGDGAITSAGAHDPIVARYDRAGTLLWRQAFGGADDESAGALAVAGNGDVFVAGSIARPPETDALLPGCFVAKLAGGRVVWSRTIRGTGDQLCRSIAVNEAGYVFVAGSFEGRVEVGEGMASRGKHDIWLAAFARGDGAPRWARQIGGAGNELARALAVDPRGDVLLGGQFSGEVPPADGIIDIGTGALHSVGDFDALLAKFAMTGEPRWARGFGDVGFDLVKSIAADRDGDIVVSGAWMRPQDFHGAIPLVTGVMDGLLARYDGDGKLRWQHVFTGGGSQAHHVVIDEHARIWVSGHFKGDVELGGRSLHSTEDSAAYVAAFTPAGVPIFAQLAGAPAAHYGYTIASGPGGAIALALGFAGTTRFCDREVTSATTDATLVGVMIPLVP